MISTAKLIVYVSPSSNTPLALSTYRFECEELYLLLNLANLLDGS
jgi:hypothetical protein